MLFGVDFSLKNRLNVKNYFIPSIGLSELPFDLDFYRIFGIFNCEPFVRDHPPLTWLQLSHLEQLMFIQKIKLKKVKTKIGLDPVARLYLYLKNS